MGLKKVTELNALEALTSDDYLLVINDPEGTPVSNYIQASTVLTYMQTGVVLTADIGSTVQGYSAVLAGTTASFTTAQQTKLGLISVTQSVNLDDLKASVDALPAVLRSEWDASGGIFPGGGTAQTGDSYLVTTGGTVDSISFATNDLIIALADNASTTTYSGNWIKQEYAGGVTSVNSQTGAVVLDADDISVSGTTNKFTTAADISKLAGIEALADVTDADNVTAALRGATLTNVSTPATNDQILMRDASNTNAIVYADRAAFMTVRIVEWTANYTVKPADNGTCLNMNKSTTVNVTFATNAVQACVTGTVVMIRQMGAGTVNLIAASGVTLSRKSGKTLSLNGQYATVFAHYQGADVWVITGDLV